MAAEPETCGICIEEFNKSTHKKTTCAKCGASACRTCLQTFLLMDTSVEPKCPSCNVEWSHEFLHEEFTAAFRLKALKAHREKVLLDRELARLPETMEDAERYRAAKDQLAALDAEEAELKRLRAADPNLPAFNELQAQLDVVCREYNKKYVPVQAQPATVRRNTLLEELRVAYMKKRKPIDKKIRAITSIVRIDRRLGLIPVDRRKPNGIIKRLGAPLGKGAKQVVPTRSVLHKCAATGCEGFLDTSWKCTICSKQVCRTCREIVVTAAEHTCNPEIVESIKAIRLGTKPCPKCASLISKVDGCDQMWCTQCHTAFSWNTGEIQTTVVHNPHYFQWLRENGGRVEAPRHGGACGAENIFVVLTNLPVPRDSIKRRLEEFVSRLPHLHTVNIQASRRQIEAYNRDEWRRRLRVQRIVGELGDAEWKTTLQRKEKAYHRVRAKLYLQELFYNASVDIVSHIRQELTEQLTRKTLASVFDQLKKLYEFVKEQNKKTAKAYGCKPWAENDLLGHGARALWDEVFERCWRA